MFQNIILKDVYKSNVKGNFKTEIERNSSIEIKNKLGNGFVKDMFKSMVKGRSNIELERALQQ